MVPALSTGLHAHSMKFEQHRAVLEKERWATSWPCDEELADLDKF
jgi:hypothetical protein